MDKQVYFPYKLNQISNESKDFIVKCLTPYENNRISW